MSSILVGGLHAIQFSFSAYSLYLASIAIRNLHGYEEQSEKAAEWSSTAAEQLHKTRTTQTSGTVATLLTCLSSLALIFYPAKLPQLAAAAANITALTWARSHVGEFWAGKSKIPMPGVGDYNEAITKTREVRLNMLYLSVSWGVVGLVALVL